MKTISISNDDEENIYDPSSNPARDFNPALVLGVQSIIGTMWWILTWFLYFKTKSTDNGLVDENGKVVGMPLGWFWYNLMDTSHGWMAASYFSTFIAYLFISFFEFLSWISYAAGNHAGAVFWF